MKRRRPAACAVALLVLASLSGAPAAAVDPFHENLLREGMMAYERGELDKAVQYLRLACFGMLEEPAPLAGCLVRLAVAEGAAGDRAAFSSTFSRLLEVEQRFGAYSRAEVPPELRAELEAHAERWISYENLGSVPAFAASARRNLADELAELARAERRDRIEAHLAAQPDEDWLRLMLAELELEAGRPGEALRALADVEEPTDQGPRLACLVGRARAALDDCASAVDGLRACPPAASGAPSPEVAEALLRCHVRLGHWNAAEALLAEMPQGLAETPSLRKVAREVRRRAAEGGAVAAGDGGRAAERPAPPAPPADDASAELPAEARARLEEARSLLASARRANELAPALELATTVAEAHPASREAQQLAGEIAYRASRWTEAVRYLERASPLDEARPELHFYYAVALYESGDRERAAEALRPCLPKLRKTDYVREYARRILGDEP